MRLQVENCIVDIDENATREYYLSHPALYDCECKVCRAFLRHAPEFPEKVRAFFSSCGIDDMRLVTEVSPLDGDEGPGPYYIDGWFFAVGSMEGGDPPKVWYPPANKLKRFFSNLFDRKRYVSREVNDRLIRYSRQYEVDDDFLVSFSNQADLIPDDFPKDFVQINFTTHIPGLENE